MFKRIVRKDGSVIILVPKKDTKSATFEVLYKVGSRQETDANNGVSHFVEHLMFKGTHRRPNTIDISKELDSIGAEYNAFTGKEHTGYYITADSTHLPLAIDMISDMVHNSKFDPQEIDRERGVIVEEINMYEDNPLMYIEDVFEEHMFAGSNLGRSIAGPRVNIQTISRNSLYNYYKKYYYSSNIVIGLAGNFNEAQALKFVDKLFPLEKKSARVKNKKIVLAKQTSPKIRIVKRSLEQVQLMLGFKTLASNDKNFNKVQVLANVLGGNMSSRLFLNIRERKGLCYFIRAATSPYEHVSAFTIQAGLNKEKTYEALEAIKEEINDVVEKGISADELKRAKDNIRGRLILRLENAGSHLNFLLSQEIIEQKIKDLDELLAEVDRIKLSDVNQIAKDIFQWPNANLAIIGPFEDKNKFLKILKK
ncbi:insulinase family protein [Candidatus Parcubacteria bacterium]|nr:MAG: insulinase family protein [Candidatus Parcubacteria bacterium]